MGKLEITKTLGQSIQLPNESTVTVMYFQMPFLLEQEYWAQKSRNEIAGLLFSDKQQ